MDTSSGAFHSRQLSSLAGRNSMFLSRDSNRWKRLECWETLLRTSPCNTEFSGREMESLEKRESLVGFGLSGSACVESALSIFWGLKVTLLFGRFAGRGKGTNNARLSYHMEEGSCMWNHLQSGWEERKWRGFVTIDGSSSTIVRARGSFSLKTVWNNWELESERGRGPGSGEGWWGEGQKAQQIEYELGIKCPVLRSDPEPLF